MTRMRTVSFSFHCSPFSSRLRSVWSNEKQGISLNTVSRQAAGDVLGFPLCTSLPVRKTVGTLSSSGIGMAMVGEVQSIHLWQRYIKQKEVSGDMLHRCQGFDSGACSVNHVRASLA